MKSLMLARLSKGSLHEQRNSPTLFMPSRIRRYTGFLCVFLPHFTFITGAWIETSKIESLVFIFTFTFSRHQLTFISQSSFLNIL